MSKRCRLKDIDCIYAGLCLHCEDNKNCIGKERCGNHKYCFQCNIINLKHDEILPCEMENKQ